MTAGHLLAAPDRIVPKLGSILGEHGIVYEIEYTIECNHTTRVIDLTCAICRIGKTQVGMGLRNAGDGKVLTLFLHPNAAR